MILGFGEMGCDFFGGDVGRGDGGVVGLDCDFWDLERWAVISLAAMLGVGEGVLSGLDCCSPVAKCPKDGVGNGQILGFGEMGCDFFGGDVGRVGRECCLD